MFYVYILESVSDGSHRYVGCTADLKARLIAHNAGGNHSTAQHRPWRIVTYCALDSESKARAFEKYLKSGSGRTFARRHFL